MIIAIIGPDGSGKTTLVKKLNHKFDFHNTECFNFIFSINKKNKKPQIYKNKKIYKRNTLVKIIIFVYFILNIYIKYLKILFLKLKTNKNILCERYFYDRLISLVFFGYLPKKYINFFIKIIPKPDILIILNGDPYILQKREIKDWHNIEFFITLVSFYKNIKNINKNNKKSIYLNTTKENTDIQKTYTKIKNFLENIIYEKK